MLTYTGVVYHRGMEDKSRFLARVEPHMAPSDFVRVRGAYYLSKYGHRGQVRKELDGEGSPLRYFEHPRRVALILMDEVGCHDPSLICTALLHDTAEDTDDIDCVIIEQFFGKDVARHVRLLTKDTKEGYMERALLTDANTAMVKLCDRTDNLRSLPENDASFRGRQLEETYEYLTTIHNLQPYDDTVYLKRAKRLAYEAYLKAGGKSGIFV